MPANLFFISWKVTVFSSSYSNEGNVFALLRGDWFNLSFGCPKKIGERLSNAVRSTRKWPIPSPRGPQRSSLSTRAPCIFIVPWSPRGIPKPRNKLLTPFGFYFFPIVYFNPWAKFICKICRYMQLLWQFSGVQNSLLFRGLWVVYIIVT